jgi:hypothetical protein
MYLKIFLVLMLQTSNFLITKSFTSLLVSTSRASIFLMKHHSEFSRTYNDCENITHHLYFRVNSTWRNNWFEIKRTEKFNPLNFNETYILHQDKLNIFSKSSVFLIYALMQSVLSCFEKNKNNFIWIQSKWNCRKKRIYCHLIFLIIF